MTALARFIATGFYSGYAPVAPGTAGSVVAVAPALLLAPLAWRSPLAYVIVVAVVMAVSVWAADVHARAIGVEDPGEIVIDEIAGYLLAVAFLPVTWQTLLAGFLVFRLLDIVKPPPIAALERLHGGLGIVADDLAAGVLTNLLLRLALLLGFLPAS